MHSVARLLLLGLLLLAVHLGSGVRAEARRRPRRSRRSHAKRHDECRSVLFPQSCRKPADKSWCLQPMQSFTYEDVRRAGQQDVQLNTEYAQSTGKFAHLMSPRDGKLSTANLHHLTLHKGNRYAIHVLERTGRWKGKREFLPDRDLGELEGYDWRSCAVVGSSGSMLRHNYGKEIDRHTAVIRFNEAPTRGFERHVGSRTTLRLQNPERVGFSEGKELCLSKHFANLSSKKCKIVPLSPQFIAYTRYYWYWNPKRGFQAALGKHGEKRIKMSTGFIGIALAAHLCSSVTIYGFEAGTGKNKHYYNKTNTRGLSDWHKRHPWELEKGCIDLLKKSPRVRLK